MNILPSQEQQEILSVIESFLSGELPVTRYRDIGPDAGVYDNALWQQLVELGWFGIAAPEHVGGSGLSLADEMMIYYEAGKQLISPSVLATSMAVKLAIQLEDFPLAEALIGGQTRVALANVVSLTVDGSTATGELQLFDANNADLILAITTEQLVLIDSKALHIESQPAMDASSTLDKTVFSGVDANVVSADSGNIGRQLQVLICAQLAGITSATMDMAVEYAKEREQFGQAIGAFQAIQHICADMFVFTEASHQQTVMGCLALHEEREDADTQLASAVLICMKAADHNCRQNIQIHGGMGFTMECSAHLFLKRAYVYETLLKNISDVEATLLSR